PRLAPARRLELGGARGAPLHRRGARRSRPRRLRHPRGDLPAVAGGTAGGGGPRRARGHPPRLLPRHAVMADGGKRPTRSPRVAAERVKTARGRTASSTHWLARQLNDPYVHRAKREGYHSRAAFKLIELDDRFKL